MSALVEKPVLFHCGSNRLLGIVHSPAVQHEALGVVIVIGGPQYRVGSHRQFLLTARQLAAAGYPVLRFDCRGMGDSEGEFPGFERIGDDIRAAIGALLQETPGLKRVALLGLCDAASACLLYCATDARVERLILANPWVRTEASEGEVYLRHYYLERLLQGSFWRKLFTGRFELVASLRDLSRKCMQALGRGGSASKAVESQSYVARMLEGLKNFRGKVLIVLSGRDLVAQEFSDRCGSLPEWAQALAREDVEICTLPEADHTFSARVALQQANDRCVQWLAAGARVAAPAMR